MIGILLRVLLVAAITLLVGAAAYAFSANQAEVYSASTRFEFGRLLSPELQIIGADFAAEPDVDEEIRISTEAADLDSFDVSRATARSVPELGLAAGQVAARTDAEPVRGTLTVRLTATGGSADSAAALANAYSAQFLDLQRRRERRRAERVEDALQTRLDRLPPGDVQGPIGAALRDQLSTLRVYQQVGSGSPRIIEGARASSSPSQPKTTRNVLFGLLFGLLAGIGLVALRSETSARAAASVRRGAPSRGRPVQRG